MWKRLFCLPRRWLQSCGPWRCLMKKKEQSNWWSLPLPSQGRTTMGSRHLPLGALHFTGAMKRQRQLSTGQSNYTNSWLAALLSLAHSPSLCLSASICSPLCASFTQTHTRSPVHRLGPCASSCGTMALQRESLHPLNPSPPWRQIFTALPWFILG